MSAKKKRRRAPAKRQSVPPSSTALALLHLTGTAVFLVVLFHFVPPLRAAAAAARETLSTAMAESRRAEFRRLAIARYAIQYGIPPELAAAIERAAAAEGIDPDLGFRLVQVESGFRERAVSSAGALGLTQLMPATAESLQPGITREEIFDRDTNLRLGFRYLRWLLRVYRGDLSEALHAYNRGPGTVDRIRAEGGDPANGYADRVLGGASAYRGRGTHAAE